MQIIVIRQFNLVIFYHLAKLKVLVINWILLFSRKLYCSANRLRIIPIKSALFQSGVVVAKTAITTLGQKGHNGQNPPPRQKQLDIHPFQSQYIQYIS